MKPQGVFEKWQAAQQCKAAQRLQRAGWMKQLLRAKGRELFAKYRIQKVIVFGSVADNRCDHDSDLDILALPLPAASYWEFRHELEEAVGLAIDLYTQDDDPKFLEKILARGEKIYEIPC